MKHPLRLEKAATRARAQGTARDPRLASRESLRSGRRPERFVVGNHTAKYHSQRAGHVQSPERKSITRLFKRIKSNSLALGVYIKGGPHIVPSLAKAGFDFVRPDMMFSAIDWNQMDHIVRAALLADITPWVRVAANPWLGGEDNL